MKTGWAAVVLAAAACGPMETAEPVAARTTTSAQALTIGPACRDDRWIGVKKTDLCPPAATAPGGRWRNTPLFSPVGATSGALPPGLGNFCVYQWEPNPGTSTPPAIGALPPLPGTTAPWLARDCHVIGPLATPKVGDQTAIWGALRSATARASDALATLPFPANTFAPAQLRPAQVRVAVVDSAVEGYSNGAAGNGRFPHGRAVGRVIRSLSCPPNSSSATTPCIGMVSNHLALGHINPTTVDSVNGGYFGTQAELAQAIVRAVTAWKGAPVNQRQQRLVLNLSLGWDSNPQYGGDYPGTTVSALPGPAWAVHAAITHAVCLGALVVVAAGNRTAGSMPTGGPMFPAAWERKPAPTPAQCRAFEGGVPPSTLPIFSASPAYQPLVFAVSAVDGSDAPLSLTRRGGRARLAAYGDHVVSTDGLSHTDILTGSSMAAAEVSGIAATVWGYRPSLTAAQVMALVYASGVSLSPTADGKVNEAEFCLNDACAGLSVRRVSQCRALTVACLSGAELCPATPPVCATPPAYSNVAPAWTSSTWPQAMSNVPHASGALIDALPCATEAECVAPDSKTQNKGALPWVDPQPGWTGCDVCSLGDGVLYLGMDPSFPPWESLTLTVDTWNGPSTYNLGPSVRGLGGGLNYEISGLPPSDEVYGATVSFGTPGFSTTEPIITF